MWIKITPELLKDLKEKAEKATQGEWGILQPSQTGGWGTCVSTDILTPNGNIICSMKGSKRNQKIANSEYIAAANPAVILALIDKIEEQNKLLEKLEDDLK